MSSLEHQTATAAPITSDLLPEAEETRVLIVNNKENFFNDRHLGLEKQQQ